MSETSENLCIKKATLIDNAEIYAIFEDVMPLYSEIMPGTFEDNLFLINQLIDKKLSFQHTGLQGWMIQSGKTILGFASMGELSSETIYMASLHFYKVHRRKGLGSKALKILENEYKGYKNIYLLAHKEAHWAQSFYLKNGYKELAHSVSSIIEIMGAKFSHLVEEDTILLGKS